MCLSKLSLTESLIVLNSWQRNVQRNMGAGGVTLVVCVVAKSQCMTIYIVFSHYSGQN